jgi:hypothetical protein
MASMAKEELSCSMIGLVKSGKLSFRGISTSIKLQHERANEQSAKR